MCTLQKIVRGDGATGPKSSGFSAFMKEQGRVVCSAVCRVKDFSHGAGD